MKNRPSLFLTTLALFSAIAPLGACSGTIEGPGTGGATAGGSVSGGASSGGSASGGANSGGSSSGGASSGGANSGGSSSGGANSGGASSGGANVGGGPIGGSSIGGSSTGGAATGGSTSVYPATMETILGVVRGDFTDGCGTSTCHNGEATPHFTYNDTLRADLLTIVSEECGNLKFVVPGMPEQSALLKVMRDGCGKVGKMPSKCEMTDTCYGPDMLSAVEQWILAGAPE